MRLGEPQTQQNKADFLKTPRNVHLLSVFRLRKSFRQMLYETGNASPSLFRKIYYTIFYSICQEVFYLISPRSRKALRERISSRSSAVSGSLLKRAISSFAFHIG